jgi:hypothetical protein
MLRLARVLIAMAVLLWAQPGWACGLNPRCWNFFGVTLAPTYTTGAIWLGSTSYYINKSIGAADNEKKSVPAPSSLGLRDFQYRFEWNQRAMRDGLLRASGVEYVWVVEKLLEVAPVKQPLFRCEVLREHSTLKALLAQAEPGSTANVYGWLKQMSERVEDGRGPMNRCWLHHRARQSRNRFAQQLTSDYQGEHFAWLINRYFAIKSSSKTLVICHLRAEKQNLVAAFEQVNHTEKKHHPQGLFELEQSLNRIKSKIENNTEPAHDCALSQSEAEPDPSPKP